jgi:hypothetical protein
MPQLLPKSPVGWALTALGALGGVLSVWALWPVSPRLRIAQYAQSQLGRASAAPYWQDVLPGVPPSGWPPDWCGAFALWAIHQAGLLRARPWLIGTGFLYDFPTTSNPQPGDIAYFDHNQHQAVVVAVLGNQISLVNGNGTRGAVSASTVDKSEVSAFYSIEPFLRDDASGSAWPWMAGSAAALGAGAWALLPSGSKDDRP